MDYAIQIQNFSFDTGALKEGNGFDNLFKYIAKPEDMANIGSLEKCFYFYKFNQTTLLREDKLIFVSQNLEVYYLNLYAQNKQISKLRNVKFTSIPVCARYRLNGEDVIIFSSETDNMLVWDGTNTPYEVLDAPHISSMQVHYERLFATVDGEKNSIWFSDDLDPTNWSLSLDEAGFIELIDERGALLKVVSFLDYIYIFREHGISRLSAFGDQTQFQVSNLFVSSGKIIPSSVCVCGDKILFLASDGLYKFDGVDTVKILSNIADGFIGCDNQKAISCFHESSYFLACNFQDKNKTISNTLLEIDSETYKLKNITTGVEIKDLLSISYGETSGVVAITKASAENAFSLSFIVKNGKYFSNSLKKCWKSPTSDLGNSYEEKVLRRIFVQSDKPIKINVFADDKEYVYSFDSSSSLCVKDCVINLHNFAFMIETDQDTCNIKNLKFEFKKLKRRVL